MVTKWSQETYIKAYRFAADAHVGQTVPETNISYLMHLSLVSMEVIASFGKENERDEELCVRCALLHDVIEKNRIHMGKFMIFNRVMSHQVY